MDKFTLGGFAINKAQRQNNQHKMKKVVFILLLSLIPVAFLKIQAHSAIQDIEIKGKGVELRNPCFGGFDIVELPDGELVFRDIEVKTAIMDSITLAQLSEAYSIFHNNVWNGTYQNSDIEVSDDMLHFLLTNGLPNLVSFQSMADTICLLPPRLPISASYPVDDDSKALLLGQKIVEIVYSVLEKDSAHIFEQVTFINNFFELEEPFVLNKYRDMTQVAYDIHALFKSIEKSDSEQAFLMGISFYLEYNRILQELYFFNLESEKKEVIVLFNDIGWHKGFIEYIMQSLKRSDCLLYKDLAHIQAIYE